MIVFIDRQANGTAATVTDILETQQYNSFNNLANSSRFRILYDKRHDMSYMNTTNASNDDVDGTSISGSFFANVNLPIEFSSTTGVIGEIRSNNIGLLLISQSEQGYLEGRVRVRFSDAEFIRINRSLLVEHSPSTNQRLDLQTQGLQDEACCRTSPLW